MSQNLTSEETLKERKELAEELAETPIPCGSANFTPALFNLGPDERGED